MTTMTDTEVSPVTSDNQSFLLKRVQPALSGLMDGSLSTLAPIFAVVLVTHHPAGLERHAPDPDRVRGLGHRRRRLGLRLGAPGRDQNERLTRRRVRWHLRRYNYLERS
jgi:hypothetical protein